MTLARIVSGGQTGVDRGALDALENDVASLTEQRSNYCDPEAETSSCGKKDC
jgi:hypothetical protein